jgi:hypothetical protein
MSVRDARAMDGDRNAGNLGTIQNATAVVMMSNESM